ncbi:MAG: DNA replication/repair protein RecF [Pleomorphochaeta sp.]
MKIIDIVGNNFRNLQINKPLDLNKKQIILIGSNGQGKTNLLEALYFICYGNSFRTSNIKELLNYSSPSLNITSHFLTDNNEKREISIKIKNKKREIKIDGKTIHDRKQLIYNIPCIVFSHDDIAFITGSPESRRKYFNQTMSMYDPVFFDDLRYYNKILKQRNTILKNNQYDLLDIYDSNLAKYGFLIKESRLKTVNEMNNLFPNLYSSVSDLRDVKIEYKSSWKECNSQEDILQHLKDNRERDIKYSLSNFGIHRDKFTINTQFGELSSIGSTGQQRLASLVLRATQCKYFNLKTNKEPIILVDDVLLELDHEKRNKFLSLFDDYSQGFFTFLPQEKYFNKIDLDNSFVYNVDKGVFIKNG